MIRRRIERLVLGAVMTTAAWFAERWLIGSVRRRAAR
jgi:hypothetical protein